jgi:hypothetical protein
MIADDGKLWPCCARFHHDAIRNSVLVCITPLTLFYSSCSLRELVLAFSALLTLDDRSLVECSSQNMSADLVLLSQPSKGTSAKYVSLLQASI